MGKRSFSNEGSPYARNNLDGQRNARKKHQERGFRQLQVEVNPEYFVPMFSVSRKVLPTPAIEGMLGRLKDTLPKHYRVFDARSMRMTILNQRRIIESVRAANFLPDETEIAAAAEGAARELGSSLRGVPRRLKVPAGRVDSFGDKGKLDKIGIIPLGWKGFNARYAERATDAQRSILPMPVFIRETHIVLGNIVTALSGYEEADGIRTAGLATTPHMTVAQKQTGGSISQSEMQGVAAIVQEAMHGEGESPEFDEFELFDPLVRVKTATNEPIYDIAPRSQRLGRFGDLIS